MVNEFSTSYAILSMDLHIRKLLCSISLIYLVLFVGKLDTSVLSSPGDVTVVGMFEVFEPDGKECSDAVKINSVMYAEAIRWYLKQLSEVGGIPFTIGFEAYTTCHIDSMAAEAAFKLVNRLLQPEVGQKLIAGVIGPEYSSEAAAVSRVLSAVHEEDRLPQVGFSATASSLRDKEEYPNFISVVPDDGVQTEAIVQSLLHLGWNRIAIVYEDNGLGQEASVALTQRANKSSICIALKSPIDVNNGVNVASINEVLEQIIYGTGDVTSVNGFVFFGSVSTANVLFKSIKSNDIQSAPIALLTESIELDTNAFKEATGKLYSKTQGSVAVSPPFQAVDEFQEHWTSIFTNISVYDSAVGENPWLQHVERYINTTCETNSCSFPAFIQQMFEVQPLYVQYAIFAAHAITVGITSVHKEYCSTAYGICPAMMSAFKPSLVIEKLRDKTLNLGTDFDFRLNSLESVTLTLGGENGRLRTQPDYQVFNFRRIDEQSQQFNFQKIGDLNGDVLLLDSADIRDYPYGIEENIWPDIRRAQCDSKAKCTECIPRDIPERFVHVPGDVYVVGLVPVYDRSATAECATVRTINGYQLVEGLKFAVEKANKKTGIFSNSFKDEQVGLIVLNTCNNQIVAQRILFNLIKNGLTLPNGQNLDLKNKILGFVGEVGSSLSLAIAQTLTRLRFVQISFASTSPLLSDRSNYPYFLRVVTPDDAQARVMIDIVKKLEGNFIQIIYSKGAYGEGGLAKVLEAANKENVCVIEQIVVDEENPNFYSYYEQLRKNPGARIVIVFLRSHVVRPLLDVITEQMKKGEFIFIGSEAWAKNQDILNDDNNNNLLGSFTVALEISLNTELQTHMTNLLPVGFNENPWLKLYLETKLNCYYPDSFDKSRPNACEDVVDFKSDPNFTPTPWASAAYNAIVSLLIAADNHLQSQCGVGASLCDGYMDDIEGLIQELKNVELDLHGLGYRSRVFNDNGDGNVGYILYNIQKDSNDPQKLAYSRVGQFPLLGTSTFTPELIVSPTSGGFESICPNEQVCSGCFKSPPEKTTSEQKATESGPVTTVLGVLLAVTVLVIVVLIVVLVRKVCTKPTDDPYLHPTDVGPNYDRPPVPGSHQYDRQAGSQHYARPAEMERFDYVKGDEINANSMM